MSETSESSKPQVPANVETPAVEEVEAVGQGETALLPGRRREDEVKEREEEVFEDASDAGKCFSEA